MTSSKQQPAWLQQLIVSRERLLGCTHAGEISLEQLEQTANNQARLALMLTQIPLAPAARVRAAHAQARPYLQQLPQHDPATQVVVDQEHSYTPRKILRRILDHALDHLNQIDQWLAWQAHGARPVPADGWASSAVTFAEDCMALTTAERDAWLWRIDLSVEIVAQRAAQLSPAQLHWKPSDGEWSLYQALHHLASAEVFYAVALDEALPVAAVDRYARASQRLHDRLTAALDAPEEPGMAFYDDEIGIFTPEQIAQQVLEQEHRLIHARSE